MSKGSTPTFKQELRDRLKIAKDLGYSKEVIKDMLNCKNIIQVENIMHDARLGIGKYKNEWKECG